jgi:hypothetical protein
MTEALLVGIRGAYREKKIELDEKNLNDTGWSGVARVGGPPENAAFRE